MAEIEEKTIAPSANAEDDKSTARPAARNGRPQGGKKFDHRNGGRHFNGRREEKEFNEKVVKISKVTKVVKGGKRMKFTALTVIGDGKGRYGFGLGKSGEVPEAIKKSLTAAQKNVSKIEIAKGDTVAHTVMGKFGATQVFIKPAPEGTGIVAGGAVRAILELAGIKNVYSKIYGSRTQTNVVKATIDGLKQLRNFKDVQAVRFGKTEGEAK
jgi:small subunit ribosomal protein S5